MNMTVHVLVLPFFIIHNNAKDTVIPTKKTMKLFWKEKMSVFLVDVHLSVCV
jgi:hypothetical protein